MKQLRDLDLGQVDSPGMAQIVAVAGDGSVTIDLGGQEAPALVDDSITPALREMVAVIPLTETTWWVLGRRRTSNPTTQPISGSWPVPYHVLAAVTAVPNPLIVSAIDTHSWRSSDGWSRDRIYQGRYFTSDPYWNGCGFHGAGVAPIKGRTCLYIRLRVYRANEGGVIGPQAQYIAPHAHTTRPDGAPVWTAAAQRITSALLTDGTPTDGDISRDGVKRLILPTPWGQDVLDGKIGGFGHLLLASGNGNYSINYSLAEQPRQYELEIGWA